jgi:hypothetical protein
MQKIYKIIDRFSMTLAIASVLLTPIVTWIVLNVSTRPEIITVAVELPQRKGIVTMYDAIDNEVGLGNHPDWYVDHEANIRYDDYHLASENIFVNYRSYTPEEHVCLAKNIYFEARNETLKGQLAIALVTLNRLQESRWSKEVCGVVYDNKQFSWYSDGLSDRPRNNYSYDSVALVASAILSTETAMYDFTFGSTHYHADYVDPYWSQYLVRKAKIDTHIFYYEPIIHTTVSL